jgi:hypothetical protein
LNTKARGGCGCKPAGCPSEAHRRSRQGYPGCEPLSSRDNAAGRLEAEEITPSPFSYLPLTYRETNAYRILLAEQPDGRWQIALLQNSVARSLPHRRTIRPQL